jgi:UDPglucose 6-dehydrogenase
MFEGARVFGYDPVPMENMQALLPWFCCAPSAAAALEDADACVLVTEWQGFLDLDWAAVRGIMARPVVIDGRNALDGAALVDLGFTYEGVGRRP